MANNLHISYDLYEPGQSYEAVAEAIKALGTWAKVHQSFWYANSNFSAQQAAERVRAAMDSNDKLYVVDATNNDAYWYNLGDEASEFIRNHWTR